MSKGTFIVILGLLLVLLPYLGIPALWKQYAFVTIGSLLIIVGYVIRRTQFFSDIDYGNGERGTDTFVETTQTLFTDSKVE